MTLLFLAFAFWIGYLGVEAIRLRRWRDAIPLRITVTGTRGKTSVARMLAAVLREDGRTVLAKTTGSQPRLVLPDGTERPVRRRGVPSILEQIRLLQLGAREGAEVIVAEVMSLHLENHLVETRKILRPHLVLMTNFRVDHTEAAGWTREEVAALHLADVLPGATVLIPEKEMLPGFREAVERVGGRLSAVPPSHGTHSPFAENLGLVRAAAGELGVAEGVIARGLRTARGDLGAHGVHRYRKGDGVTALTANAFAANDPRSTGMLLDWVQEQEENRPRERGEKDRGGREVVGVLNLRGDRGDRTVQWLEAMEEGFIRRFSRLYVMGFHGPAFRRGMIRRGLGEGVILLPEGDPAGAMARILAESESPEPLVFGFGNFGGPGEAFVEHWMDSGEDALQLGGGNSWKGDAHGA